MASLQKWSKGDGKDGELSMENFGSGMGGIAQKHGNWLRAEADLRLQHRPSWARRTKNTKAQRGAATTIAEATEAGEPSLQNGR